MKDYDKKTIIENKINCINEVNSITNDLTPTIKAVFKNAKGNIQKQDRTLLKKYKDQINKIIDAHKQGRYCYISSREYSISLCVKKSFQVSCCCCEYITINEYIFHIRNLQIEKEHVFTPYAILEKKEVRERLALYEHIKKEAANLREEIAQINAHLQFHFNLKNINYL